MRIILFFLLYIPVLIYAQPAQSTTGIVPPENVDVLGLIGEDNKAVVVISGVPAYNWFRGCGPTAVGMVLAYYDENGFSDIFPGSSAVLLQPVQDRIASTEHYDDYSLPLDYYPNMHADLSELPAGDEHTDNCLADFMKTSRSVDFNYWGWSWSSHINLAFSQYMNTYTTYQYSSESYYFSSFSWSMLQDEIDGNHPLVFLVDTDGNGSTDHFVTVVGYKDDLGINYYGCYHTWDQELHWYAFEQMSSGVIWGIHSAYTFRVLPSAGIHQQSINQYSVYPNPAESILYIDSNFGEFDMLDLSGRVILQSQIGNIDISFLPRGTYIIKFNNGLVQKFIKQ